MKQLSQEGFADVYLLCITFCGFTILTFAQNWGSKHILNKEMHFREKNEYVL